MPDGLTGAALLEQWPWFVAAAAVFIIAVGLLTVITRKSRPERESAPGAVEEHWVGTKSQSGQIARIMAYYGFETIPETGPLPLADRLRRFGENILISLIVLAHNAGALCSDTLARVRPIFLSRRALDHEFTAGEKVTFGA